MLTGFLRRRGLTVQQRDLNLEFFEALLSHKYLQSALEELSARLAQNDYTSDTERFWQERAVGVLPFLIRQIDQVRAQISDRDAFLDFENYATNIRYLHRACETASALHFPTRLTLSTLSM